MNPKQLVKMSRHLSKVLRHDPASVGLKLDAAGWVGVDVLLGAMKMTREELDAVVADNNKKRFAFDETGTKIRAVQGHSVEVELGYDPIEPPEVLYHGTATDTVEAIFRDGIRSMSRQHVHLSAEDTTAIQVGGRHGQPKVLKVAALRMHRAGHKFWRATNGVWLCEEVPPQYLS